MSIKKAVVSIYLFLISVIKKLKIYCKVLKNYVTKIFRKEPHVFLVGTPQYGNLGDQLIAIGELEWLAKFCNKPVVEYTHETLIEDFKCRELISRIKKDDIIFLQGGGNVNNKYMNCEKVRRRLISKLPHNKIYLFQQSINFESTEEAQKLKAETAKIYNANKNLTVFTREQTSYNTAKEMFPDLPIYMLPDMATFLFNRIQPSEDFKRSGVLFCLRSDEEKFHSEEEIDAVKKAVSSKYTIEKGDTNIHRVVTPDKRIEESQKLIDFMAHYRVIVTDRFHGVIFALLSKTPCIALKSTDHKIVDGVKWFSDYDGLTFVNSVDEIPQLIDKMYDKKMSEQPQGFDRYFEEMNQIIEM